MKKALIVICLLVLILLSFWTFVKFNSEINEEYYYKINSLIKDIDFHTAKVQKYKILIYNSEGDQIDELIFEDYNDRIKIKYVRKENDTVFFVLNASLDDENGIMFVNDDSDKMMNGIKSITRIGGNSYLYDTAG